jgi:hypothetical protein
MQTETYKRKPIYVEAVRVTEKNFVEVAAWCQGSIVTGGGVMDLRDQVSKFIKVRVINPQRERQTKAFVGDWVLYSDYQGYKVYTDGAFHNSFDPAPDTRSVEQAVEDARAVGSQPARAK